MEKYSFGLIVITTVLLMRCNFATANEEIFYECLRETNFTHVVSGGSWSPDDDKNGCFRACLKRKQNMLIDGKLILEEELKSSASPIIPDGARDEFKQIVTDCVHIANENTDECKVVLTYLKCMVEGIKTFSPKLKS